MTNSRRAIAFTFVTVGILIAGVIWLRNRIPQAIRQPITTNAAATIRTNPASPQVDSRLLYGKASLSKEEKRILYTSFEDMKVIMQGSNGPYKVLDERKTLPQAYRVGMICLKHRLNWSEVQEMIHQITGEAPAPRRKPPNEYNQVLEIGFHENLIFRFDQEGNLKSIWASAGARYKFPPLEEVTPDMSIEPPPKPAGWED